LALQIVNLSKKYVWHRAPREAIDDDDPELVEVDEPELDEVVPQGDRWALRGVNITVQPGERVGLIGSNGSGKTTLLNILAGITLPSGGYVRGKGLCVLLNSLRTPFRGQLTGRQNLHILSALLGVEADRLEARLPEILAFSAMEDFIDRRVLHYSTQQYRRLTFAAALMLDPDIILSDDTLGIGDARYQRRTEQLIADKVDKHGVIFMFASNRLSTVQELCTRVIWLEQGLVAADGPAEQVIEAFMDADNSGDDEPVPEVPDESDGSVPPMRPELLPPQGSNVVPYPPGQRIAASIASQQPATVSDHTPQEQPVGDAAAIDQPQPEARTNAPHEEDAPPQIKPSRVAIGEWSEIAKSTIEQRKTEQRKRIEGWMEKGRQWLTSEKSFATVPGLAELVDLTLDLGNPLEEEKSRLEIAVQLERPGTEVAVLIDGVYNKAYGFSSELPEHFFVPSSGLYFFTVNIDSVLFQPRTVDQPYTKTKIRAKIYLRAPDREHWRLLSGHVRIRLQGAEWEPQIPYPEDMAPVLKPLLDWTIEKAVDDAPAEARPQPEPAQGDDQVAQGDDQVAVVESGKR